MTDDPLTPLDDAHAAMEAPGAGDAARLRFFDRLADAEVFMLLEEEAKGDQITPMLFPVEGQDFVLIFDLEERLSRFAGEAAAYGAMSGRAALGVLAEAGVGVGLNLDVAPSAMLLPADAVAWLAGTLAEAPEEAQGQITAVAPPQGLPDVLIEALAAKLGSAAGLASRAYLAQVTYETGMRGHLLAFLGTRPGAEAALAQAAREALVFSGIEAGALDVAFFGEGSATAAQMMAQGLGFELPEMSVVEPQDRPGPGMDPEKPPILR